MNSDPTALERFWPLIDAALNGVATPRQAEELDLLLAQDREACRLYCECASIEAELHLLTRGRSAICNVHEQIRASSGMDVASPIPQSVLTPPPSAVPGFLTTAFHGTVNYCSSGWPMAYLTSAVVCTIGILILAIIPVNHYIQFARKTDSGSSSTTSLPSPLSPLPSPLASSSSEFPPMIGQITGMVDCKWSNGQTEASNGASVPLGRKYALSSGLMQITYDTGAKVILQGPCTYEVESKTGGYLSLGKLTAKVEKGPRSKVQGSRTAEVASGQWSVVSGRKPEIQNPKSKIPSLQPLAPSPSSVPSPPSPLPSPLFTVKTPTATVTDLGTEFGVEVSEDRTNHVEVFQGEVELARVGTGLQNVPAEKIRLIAGQTARLGSRGAIERVVASNATYAFVRALPKPKAPSLPDLAGVCMWLRADAGVFGDIDGKTPAVVGDPVALWGDQSKGGRSASQPNPTSRPMLAIGPAGKPVVRFDGADDVLAFAELQLPNDWTVIAVAGNHGDNRFFVLLGQHCGDAIAADWSDRSRLVYDGATDKSTLSEGPDFRDNAYRIFAIRKFAEGGSNAVAWHTNGLRDSLSNTDIASSHALNFNEIGARSFEDNPASAPGQFGKQDIAELIIFDRNLSNAERRSVEAYLKHKYPIPVNVNP